MRPLLILASILVVTAVAFVGYRALQFSRLWPPTSTETIELTPEKRTTLERLRAETKFLPYEYPPQSYTGAATPEDQARASKAVNGLIDSVLSHPNGPLAAKTVASLIGEGMEKVAYLETEDRDRTAGYMLEVWYILGFKGATGRFAYGSAYSMPVGYGEPLPPGWSAPDKPRPISQ